MKKKILVLTSTFPRWKNDKMPPFVYELSKRLSKDFDISVLTPNYPGAKKYELMDNMKVYRFRYFLKDYEKLAGDGILPTLKKNKLYFSTIPFFLIGEYIALKKLVEKEKPDIIHAHWIIPQGLIAYYINKKYKIPYVVTSHGSDIFALKKLNNLKRKILKNAKKITVVSNAIKDEIIKNIDSSLKDKIEVIPMGVDSKLFNPNKKDNTIKKKYKIEGLFLLFVGRLAEEKGIRYLINSMPNIIKEFPQTKLMIIGDGTLKDEIKGRIKQLNIEKNIIFIGWIDNKDLPKYYTTADIFVCPSLREGFGLTFVEAGLCGSILIGTNEGGIPDIIENNKTGFLIKKESSNEISNKIIEILKNKVILNNIKKRVQDSLKYKFDWEVITKRYAEVMR